MGVRVGVKIATQIELPASVILMGYGETGRSLDLAGWLD